jgi:predicted unusual protein kinase regulating ubiquinone biosynthesis (AarF/ABC1/UbiB family)
MKLYRIDLALSSHDLYVRVDEAQAVDVDGMLYADPHGGSFLVRADGKWHDTRAGAIRAAADQMDSQASRLTAQAAKLREEAAA